MRASLDLRWGRCCCLLGCLRSVVALKGFDAFKAGYFVAYGLALVVPYARLEAKQWKLGFTSLAVLSALFVFLMVVHVMFAYMAAADRGEKLGVPGLEGTLIFVGLMQVPVVLFQRKPDLLD